MLRGMRMNETRMNECPLVYHVGSSVEREERGSSTVYCMRTVQNYSKAYYLMLSSWYRPKKK
jgi:hypothetical protein